MTTLKEKLIALKNEAQTMLNDVRGVNGNHADMMNKLDTIETFIKDNKTAIEDEATDSVELENAYTDLKDVIDQLKTEIATLKTQNTTLKNKINQVAGLCVFSGTILGVLTGISLPKLKSVIDKYKRR